MKNINSNRSRLFARPLILAVLCSAGLARAQETEPAEEPPPAQAPQQVPAPQPQAQPQAQAQPLGQPQPPAPYGYGPYMNWRPLEATKPEEKARSNFSWSDLPFGVAGEIRTIWPQNSATRRLAGKSAPDGGGVLISYDVLKLRDKVVANVDLGWGRISRANSSPWSSDEEKLRTDLFSLGLSLRYHIFRWMAPFARVAGGIGWDRLTVGGSSGTWQDKQGFAQGSAGAGLFFRSPGLILTPAIPSLGIALTGSIEGGYFVAPSSKLALKATSDPGIKNPIPSASVPIGEMGRSAPYLRVTLGVAF